MKRPLAIIALVAQLIPLLLLCIGRSGVTIACCPSAPVTAVACGESCYETSESPERESCCETASDSCCSGGESQRPSNAASCGKDEGCPMGACQCDGCPLFFPFVPQPQRTQLASPLDAAVATIVFAPRAPGLEALPPPQPRGMNWAAWALNSPARTRARLCCWTT